MRNIGNSRIKEKHAFDFMHKMQRNKLEKNMNSEISHNKQMVPSTYIDY